ncbi:MAG: hypothetical protein SO038_04880 [Campylobacter sp.]|nr:hypothetical protein [Campylobacter sp.]
MARFGSVLAVAHLRILIILACIYQAVLKNAFFRFHHLRDKKEPLRFQLLCEVL